MAVESRLQLQPYDTTVRYYVDGTNGLDGALGTSWATAWKTLAFAQSRIAQILATNPTNLALKVFFRGAFAAESISLCHDLRNGTRVFLLHDVDDMTEVHAGTVNATGAAGGQHGLVSITVAGWVPDASDVGRYFVLDDGANRATYQVLSVRGGTIWTTCTSWPAWVINGISARVVQPSVSGIHSLFVSLRCSDDYDSTTFQRRTNVIFGLEVDALALFNSHAVACSVSALDAYIPIYVSGSSDCPLRLFRVTGFPGGEFDEDIGSDVHLYSGAGAEALVGCYASGGKAQWELSAGTSGICSGYYNDVYLTGTSFLACASCNLNSAESLNGGVVSLMNVMVGRGAGGVMFAVKANHMGIAQVSKTSVIDVPASGLTEGLFAATKHGWMQLTSTVEGLNTGAGANLYGCKVDKGGNLQMDSCPTALTGEDGDWYIEDGVAEFSAALVIADRIGRSGPDIYVGANSKVHFAAGVTKSATNPSGGGTARPVLQCRRGARVTQDAGSNFTLPAGSGNNTTDYGANGAIDIETCCDVALGLLAGGNAIATNTAVRVKKASRLAHAGAAPTWGAAALDQGGNAAAAMPAAVTSDMAAGVPEDCWVLPGAA